MYTYCGNNPLAFVDPFGLCKERGFGRRLWEGDYFGTQYGNQGLDYYASKIAFGNGNWLQKAGWYTGGFFSALWTPETYKETAMILGPSAAGAITKITRITTIVPRISLGADGATAVYIKTTSRLSGRTIKVVQKVTSTAGKIIHEHTKYTKWFLWW